MCFSNTTGNILLVPRAKLNVEGLLSYGKLVSGSLEQRDKPSITRTLHNRKIRPLSKKEQAKTSAQLM